MAPKRGFKRGLTRSGKRFRQDRRAFCASLEELKRRHSRVLSPKPVFYLGRRFIGRQGHHGIIECVVRFPVDHPNPKRILTSALLQLIEEFGSDPPFYVSTVFS